MMKTATFPTPPCYGCKERSAECHGHCPAYGAFAKEQEERRQKRYKEMIKQSY